jgi:predicted acetyltransferase
MDPVALLDWVRLLAHLADPATTYLDETVPSHYFWVVDSEPGEPAGALVGFLAFRHRLSAWLLEQGGHVGYSVRPSRRREGHASRALALAVSREAPLLGLDRVLVTCDTDNLASARTIEACGGELEDVRAGKRRYWLAVTPSAGSASAGR